MRYISLIFVFILLGCVSAQQKNPNKTEAIQKELDKDSFQIYFEEAFPKQSSGFIRAADHINFSSSGSSSQKINISDGNYYVKFEKDSVFGDLPFYGERYSGHSTKNNDRIEFESKPKNYKFSSKTKNNRIQTNISFVTKDLNSTAEEYEVSIKIFENGKANMHISSSNRSGMGFKGKLDFVEK